MHNRTARNSENCLEKLKEMILNHQFESNLPDEEPFIFNLQFDDNGELILGDGTKNKPFRILFSSKYMIHKL